METAVLTAVFPLVVEHVPHLADLRIHVALVVGIRRDLYRHALRDLEAIAREPRYLDGIVRHQAQLLEAEVGQDLRVEAIASCLRTYRPRFVVFDPVMVSTSGHRLIEEDAISALTRELMPLASLITPNLSEAEVLTEHCISNVDTMKAAASELLKFGCGSVLLKGGHLEGDKMCDVLQTAGEDKPHLFISDKIESKNTHGTGCTLSSAIATFLALGYDMPQAVEHAKAYVTKGIHAGKDVHIGEGHGPLNHFYAPVPMKTMK